MKCKCLFPDSCETPNLIFFVAGLQFGKRDKNKQLNVYQLGTRDKTKQLRCISVRTRDKTNNQDVLQFGKRGKTNAKTYFCLENGTKLKARCVLQL